MLVSISHSLWSLSQGRVPLSQNGVAHPHLACIASICRMATPAVTCTASHTWRSMGQRGVSIGQEWNSTNTKNVPLMIGRSHRHTAGLQ